MLTDKQLEEGWIPHFGGPCPVPPRSYPRVRFIASEPSGSGEVLACNWLWQIKGRNAIIAYRPVPHD